MRLIDADALVERLKHKRSTDRDGQKYNGLESAISQVNKMPTVDIKTEVAKEIFEEIEGTLKAATWLVKADFSSTVKERELKEKCCRDFLEYITELKNKYTKGGTLW